MAIGSREIVVSIRYLEDKLGLRSAMANIGNFASTASSTVGSFASTAGTAVTGFGSKLVSVVTGPIKWFGSQIREMGEHAKWASLFVGAALGSIAKDVVSTAAEFQRFRAGAEYLTGTKEAADKFALSMTKVAKDTMFSSKEVIDYGMRILGVTRDVDQTTKAMTIFGDTIAATGGGISELESATRAYIQMNSKAKVSSEELNRQFANANIPVIRLLAESIVKDVNHPLRQYIETTTGSGGAVGASAALTKSFQTAQKNTKYLGEEIRIAEEKLKKYKEEGKVAQTTIDSLALSITKKKDKMDAASTTIDKYNSAQSQVPVAAKKATLSVEEVMSALQEVGDLGIPGELGAASVLRALEEGYKGASEAMRNTYAFQVNLLGDNLDILKQRIMGVTDKWETQEGTLMGLTRILQGLNKFITDNEVRFSEWARSLGNNIYFVGGAVAFLVGAFSGFIVGILGPVLKLALFYGIAGAAITLLGTTLINATGGIDVWKEKITQAGDALKTAFNQEKISSISNGFSQFGQNAANAFGQLRDALSSVVSFLSTLFGPLIEKFSQVGQQIKAQFGDQLAPALIQLKDAFINFWTAIQPILSVFMVVLGAVASVVLGFVSMVLLGFASMLPHIIGIVTGIVQVVSAAFNIIASVITLVVETIKLIFTRNWDEVDAKNKQIMAQLLLGVTQAFTGIFNIIKSNLAAVIDTIKGWVEGVIAFFTGLYNALIGHSIIPDLVEGILGWFNTLKQRGISAISDLVSSIAGKFSGLASSAWSWGKDLVNNWINGIKEAARNLGGWAKDKFGEMTGMYAHGGIIPGPIGAPVPIIAHGGERVVPRSGVDGNGGGGGGFAINFYGNINMDSEERVQELADKISRIFGRQNELARYSAGY